MTNKVSPTLKKRTKLEDLKMCDFKTYFKGRVIKTIWQ